MKRVRIFPQPLERIYLFLVAVSWLVLLAGYAGLLPANFAERPLVEFFCAFIFLNSVHVVFTLLILAALPEFRAWLARALTGRRVIPFVLVVAAVGYCSFLYASASRNLFFLYVTTILVSFHNSAQTKGLALLYNKKARADLSAAESAKQARVEKIERRLFDLLIGLVVTYSLARNVFHAEGLLRTAFLALSVLLFLGIVANSFRYPRAKASNKPWFLSGVIFNALACFNGPALFLQRSLHGVEYAFLCYGMSKRSTRDKTWLAAVGVFAGLSTFVVCELFREGYFARRWVGGSYFPLLAGTSFFVEYLHYYLDSLMFKTRRSGSVSALLEITPKAPASPPRPAPEPPLRERSPAFGAVSRTLR